ncbi:hypothetical protein [Sporosarcina sp. FSL K6-5500]|uniref:hypothetical protein n=1 Tax=Sporosarcina sp. FSL K6-5500 TaxID=2921558 RepID=UPI0030F7C126
MTETNEERLERIKAIHNVAIATSSEGDPRMEVTDIITGLFANKETDWLIEQAEQLQVMKKEFADDIDFKRREVHGLQEENKRLREEIEQLEGELKEWADLVEPTLDV